MEKKPKNEKFGDYVGNLDINQITNKNKDLLTGTKLTQEMFIFIKKQKISGILDELKSTTKKGKLCKIHIIRCKALQALIDYITKVGKIGDLTSQHNVIKTFLGSYRLDIPLKNFEVILKNLNRRIDLTKGSVTYEVKTTTNLLYNDVSKFINKYYDKIIKENRLKNIWWLCFLNQLDESKLKKGYICIYYMFVIELKSENLKMGAEHQKMITEDIQNTLNEAVKDNFDEEAAIFLPVRNHIVVDNLRKKMTEKDKKLAENKKESDKKLAEYKKESDKKLAEYKKESAKYKRESAKYKKESDEYKKESAKKLAEKDKKLAEKDKIIEEFLNKNQ